MSDPFNGVWSMFGSWIVGHVNIMVWIIGFFLLSVVKIFVKGNH